MTTSSRDRHDDNRREPGQAEVPDAQRRSDEDANTAREQWQRDRKPQERGDRPGATPQSGGTGRGTSEPDAAKARD
jgi:hypothetical protein